MKTEEKKLTDLIYMVNTSDRYSLTEKAQLYKDYMKLKGYSISQFANKWKLDRKIVNKLVLLLDKRPLVSDKISDNVLMRTTANDVKNLQKIDKDNKEYTDQEIFNYCKIHRNAESFNNFANKELNNFLSLLKDIRKSDYELIDDNHLIIKLILDEIDKLYN